MRTLLLVPLFLLTACATVPSPRPHATSIPDGRWFGDLDWHAPMADERTSSGKLSLTLSACAGEVRVWLKGDDGVYRTPTVDFRIDSHLGSHTIHFIDAAATQPDWVEIQTLTFIEIDSETARVQWTRAVSNRDLDAKHSNRAFFAHALGTLEHGVKECHKSDVHPVRAKTVP